MNKFCSKECEDMGSICDFCKNYKDEFRDIKKLDEFAGNGICLVDDSEVDALGGYNCDNFQCFKVKG